MYLSILDLEFPDAIGEIEKSEIQKSINQFFKRKRKIRQRKLGSQRDWLLALLPRYVDGEFEIWIQQAVLKIAHLLPNSAYKLIFYNLANVSRHSNSIDKTGIFSFRLTEGFQVLCMPELGICAFRSPPGNLKKNLSAGGIHCEWNWAFGSSLYGDQPTPNAESALTSMQKTKNTRLQTEFGEGEGSTVAVIDGGVCPNSEECSSSLSWQGRVFEGDNAKYRIARTDSNFVPKSDHGTMVGSLICGTNIGVAPKARLISFALPFDYKGDFDHLSLYFAILQIFRDDGAILDGTPLKEKIDTLVIPAGVILEKKVDPVFQEESIKPVLMKLVEEFDIAIVAAIGNTPGQVAFPACFQFVYSVGHLKADGLRHPSCGYGKDTTGNDVPRLSAIASEVISEGLGNRWFCASGSSFAAARVGGIFSLLTSKYPTPSARWSKIYSLCERTRDNIGELNVLESK